MTDNDLTQIGIETFGARRRMQQAITGRIQERKFVFHYFSFFHYYFLFWNLGHALASIKRY
jgi:hypothetical protein